MTTRYDILHFDDPLPVDRVVFALAPIDNFTGAIVRTSVTAKIESLDARALRNLSGMLVFANLEEQDSYQVEIDAEAAGYFNASRKIQRPLDDAPDSDRLRRIELYPLPSAAFTRETTVVRGVVHNDGEPVETATIGAILAQSSSDPEPQPDRPLDFSTLSDKRGAFALPLRLQDLTPGQVGVPTDWFWFCFRSEDLPERKLIRKVTDGAEHRFGMPIDLAEDDSQVDPVLLASSP